MPHRVTRSSSTRRRFPSPEHAHAALLALLHGTLAARQIHASHALGHAELGRAVLREHSRVAVEPMAIEPLARTCTGHVPGSLECPR